MQIKCAAAAGGVNEKFCGNVLPAEMTFDCPLLEVIFFSDSSTQRKGFKLRFIINSPPQGWQCVFYICNYELLTQSLYKFIVHNII